MSTVVPDRLGVRARRSIIGHGRIPPVDGRSDQPVSSPATARRRNRTGARWRRARSRCGSNRRWRWESMPESTTTDGLSSLRHGTSPSSRSPTGLSAADTSSRMRKPACRDDSSARARENRSAAAPRRAVVASRALAAGVGTGSSAPSVSGSDSMNRTADASGRGRARGRSPRVSAQRRHGHDNEITAEVERLQAAMSNPFVLSIAGRPEAAPRRSLAVPACPRIGPKSTTPRGHRVYGGP